MSFKSGFTAIAGRPNTGKSTLLNKLAGDRIAITSEKPQTTRNAIKGIVTRDDCQMVFIDTPGIHKPHNKLGEYMVKVAINTMNGVDVVLFLIDANDIKPGPGDEYIASVLAKVKTPVILVINKIDLLSKLRILEVISAYKDLMDFHAIIPVSALTGDGTDILEKEILKLLPEGPEYFPEDISTDQPERFIAAEIIREKLLTFLSEEVPHGTGVVIEAFSDHQASDEADGLAERSLVEIDATIYCEKETHKGIIIGKKGLMLKKVGTLARHELESLLGTKVYLKLWVKVKPGWRNNPALLKELGYSIRFGDDSF